MHNVEIDDCYNKNQMPPTIDGKGIMVNISMNLNSLLSIDEPTQVRYLLSYFLHNFLHTYKKTFIVNVMASKTFISISGNKP